MNAWRFKVVFVDGFGVKEYLSPDVRLGNPGWNNEHFTKPVEHLEFFLPTGHKIIMAGMEAYNLFVEASRSFSNGRDRLEAIYLCGKYPDSPKVEVWRIANGKITRQTSPFGHEWGGGPTEGWKVGIKQASPISKILEA